jgi:hemolysin activation/secretion protein
MMAKHGWMIAAALAAAGMSRAQDAGFEPFAPRMLPPGKGGHLENAPPAATPGAASTEVLVEALTGLVVVHDVDRLQQKSGRSGVHFLGFDPPAAEVLKPVLRAHLGRPLTLAELDSVCRTIVAHYQSQGRPVVDALVPQGQDIANGVVQILVIEGKVGEVRVEGARHFSPDLLRSYLRASPGEPIVRDPLLADLEWINANPFRRADLVFEAGDEFGSTDLILRTEDRFPWRFYTGIENTGVESTGEARILAGFNHGNAFGLDHQWSGQFTGDSEFDRLRAWSSAYLIPLPSRQWLSFYGSYVESAPDNPAPFDQEGTNWELGTTWRIPVRCSASLRHEWSFGYEFKRIDNNLQFGGVRVFANAVDVSQFLAGYEGSLASDDSRTSWGTTLYVSPGGLGGHSEDADYRIARPGAEATYAYLEGRLSHQQELPWQLTWQASLTGQVATGNLIGSEQQGLGGFRSVRGYREYEHTGDHAVILRNELRGPAVPLVGRWLENLPDQLQPLAFIDCGTAWKDEPVPGEDKQVTLASAGVGVRYSLDPWFSAYLDWGLQLRDSGKRDPRSSGIHLGMTASF